MEAAALAVRVRDAWLAAFGREPDDVTVHGEGVRVEGLALYPDASEGAGGWGVGMLVTAQGKDDVMPKGVFRSVEDALFYLLTVASVADEARRAMQGKPPRWKELMG